MSRPDRTGFDYAASIQEVNAFLRQVRAEVNTPGRFDFIPRKANLDGLARLGFTVGAAKNEILSLTYRDYDRGPLADHSGEGVVWEFIKDIDGTLVYIKLKVDSDRGCVCMSFHESNGPYTLPYRESSCREDD
ncbi:MAG TPA: type II toxin-antitoxin system MqsR family toxin [Firmicutes bacterium]|nr:type II toxin-antitoxin system MqsR family toxin [Bacillota bacterium]